MRTNVEEGIVKIFAATVMLRKYEHVNCVHELSNFSVWIRKTN
jgi:hypothetical protein